MGILAHEKVAIPIPIVTCILPIPIPIFGIFVFPFPQDSHGNPMGMGIPFPCTSLDGDDRVNGVSKSDRCGGRQGDRLDVIAEIT